MAIEARLRLGCKLGLGPGLLILKIPCQASKYETDVSLVMSCVVDCKVHMKYIYIYFMTLLENIVSLAATVLSNSVLFARTIPAKSVLFARAVLARKCLRKFTTCTNIAEKMIPARNARM